jgi:hypothetical protein
MLMTEVPLDELGPVDYIVVEFPAGASSFTGEMAAELRELQAIEAELAELLAAEDVDNLAAAMEPGSTAGVLISMAGRSRRRTSTGSRTTGSATRSGIPRRCARRPGRAC